MSLLARIPRRAFIGDIYELTSNFFMTFDDLRTSSAALFMCHIDSTALTILSKRWHYEHQTPEKEKIAGNQLAGRNAKKRASSSAHLEWLS
jgi:hypothetical protein